MKHEILLSHDVLLNESPKYTEEQLLIFLKQYPRVIQLMTADSLVFIKDGKITFPKPISPDEERSDAELANQAFRRRVAMHTTAVGLTMNILLNALMECELVKLKKHDIALATEAMCLHDLKKLNEIFWRKTMKPSDRGPSPSDMAYDAAEAHLANLLMLAGLPPEYIQLAGSIGHNGARDYIVASSLWTKIRICAYLADEIMQETAIQTDPLAKVKRLQQDQRYSELNEAGFPDQRDYLGFTRADGTLTSKFEIQEMATTLMLNEIGQALDIAGEDLGKFLVVKATEQGFYQSRYSFPDKITDAI